VAWTAWREKNSSWWIFSARALAGRCTTRARDADASPWNGHQRGDWNTFIGHVEATLDAFELPPQERGDVLGFVESLKTDIVEN
jgi:hypothetical protein